MLRSNEAVDAMIRAGLMNVGDELADGNAVWSWGHDGVLTYARVGCLTLRFTAVRVALPHGRVGDDRLAA